MIIGGGARGVFLPPAAAMVTVLVVIHHTSRGTAAILIPVVQFVRRRLEHSHDATRQFCFLRGEIFRRYY